MKDAAWQRYKIGEGRVHALTEQIAKVIHEDRYPGKSWDRDRDRDMWLAAGSWRAAEAVVKTLALDLEMAE